MAKVFDASAVLAFLYAEPGAAQVRAELPRGMISAVNAAEVLAVLVRNGLPLQEAQTALEKTRLAVLDFSLAQAIKTAELLSPSFRRRRISLGDRACMATALLKGVPVVTADRTWVGLGVPDLRVELVRG
jgi:ribonuclease VapC